MDAHWTHERNAEAIRTLEGSSDAKKDRRYYHIRNTFELVEVAGVKQVRRKRDRGIMAVDDNMNNIIRDIHVGIRHKGQRKTHKKISEHYSNISVAAVNAFIATCDRRRRRV